MQNAAKAMLRTCITLDVYVRKAYSLKYQKNLKTENQTQKKVEGRKYKKQMNGIEYKHTIEKK